MPNFRRAIAALALLIAVSPPIAADTAAKAKKDLTAIYLRQSKAFCKKDVSVLAATTTPDYVAKQPNGQAIPKFMVVDYYRKMLAPLSNIKWPRTVSSLKVNGDQAIAVVTGRCTGVSRDKAGKAVKSTMVLKTRDTWARSGKTWMLKQSDILDMTTTTDGKRQPRKK